MSNDTYIDYIHDVLEGKQVVGEYVYKTVERTWQEMQRTDDDFEWVFDFDKAEAYITFIQKYTVHTRGKWAGEAFVLSPWQQYFISQLFGWTHKEKGYRRYRTGYLFVARKSGKTQLAAAIAAAMMVLDKEPQGEYVFAATTRDQAKIAFDELQRITRKAPKAVKDMFTNSRFACEEARYGGVAKALASDAHTLDGLSLQLGVMDEFHAQKDSDLLNVLKSSMGSRTNPLMLSITTAGFIPDGPCAMAMKTAKEVLDGVKKDDRTFTLLYELDKEDDWQDESVWIKANPGLGTSISYDYLRSQLVQARNIGGRALTEWLTKHGNLFQNGDQDWIEAKDWKATAEDWTPDPDTVCYAGIDLASVSDITSLALVWDKPDGTQYLKTWHWLPEAAVKRRLAADETHVYGKLEELENVFITPGNATDYDAIRRFIAGTYITDGVQRYDDDNLMEKYNLHSVAYDKWNSSQFIIHLMGDGVDCVPVIQGYRSLSTPTKHIERTTLDETLKHEDCLLMEWMLANVVLEVDPAGNIKPNKAKSGDKIDGVAATVTAIANWLTALEEEDDSPYEMPDDWMPGVV